MSAHRFRTLLAATAVAATALIPNAAHAATMAASDPTSLASSPREIATSYVGRSSAGISLGIVVQPDGTAAGYLCDGTGKVSAWLTGTIGPSGKTISLTGTDANATVDLGTRVATLRGKAIGTAAGTATVKLQLPVRGAGLYRAVVTSGSSPVVYGWIATNDGWSVGSGSLGGKPVVNVAQSPDGSGEPTVSPTSGGGSGATPPPEPTGLIKNIACGLMYVKMGKLPSNSPELKALQNEYFSQGCNRALTG